jgi:aspartyl-tRNA(Asn)/glutamyl-tRNA(Gln) amidotransferase subunit A
MYLQDIYTVQANLTGNPAVSLPIGLHPNGMPFGLQLIGNHFEEKKLLAISAYLNDFC